MPLPDLRQGHTFIRKEWKHAASERLARRRRTQTGTSVPRRVVRAGAPGHPARRGRRHVGARVGRDGARGERGVRPVSRREGQRRHGGHSAGHLGLQRPERPGLRVHLRGRAADAERHALRRRQRPGDDPGDPGDHLVLQRAGQPAVAAELRRVGHRCAVGPVPGRHRGLDGQRRPGGAVDLQRPEQPEVDHLDDDHPAPVRLGAVRHLQLGRHAVRRRAQHRTGALRLLHRQPLPGAALVGQLDQEHRRAGRRRLRRRRRAGLVLREHLLRDHGGLRPVRPRQRPVVPGLVAGSRVEPEQSREGDVGSADRRG
ncbi:hypothetical protein SBRY_100047 [Actinacidiphila bryophytorum]|uniref:Uncharacterized protein n=1 Tax=Actinacidiphila bryophytorum TaxID=1436133 RepID=A0A9W4E233_9ACTN|nr:hypothetical protein SBRY_100047 [Actinacidiphila bryophytorum]